MLTCCSSGLPSTSVQVGHFNNILHGQVFCLEPFFPPSSQTIVSEGTFREQNEIKSIRKIRTVCISFSCCWIHYWRGYNWRFFA